MLRILFFALAIALTGCNTASTIMQGYIGKPLTQPMIDYGPPATAFDMGDGRRAFIWVRNNNVTLPGQAHTSGTIYNTGAVSSLYASTTITPPTNLSWQCQYVAYARKVRTDVEGPAAWQIVGFEPPKSLCE